jgi:hypothetical protein
MSLLSIRWKPEPLRSLAFGSIGVGYTGVGTAIDHPVFQFLLQNYTDALLTFSFDGVNDHFVLASGSQWINDISSNKSLLAQGLFLAQGSRLYVKENGTPSTGSVYFSVFYGAD